MRPCRQIALACLLLAAPLLSAQKNRHEPLTEAQIEEIREAGIEPPLRIRLYAKFISEHVNRIKALTTRPRSADRAVKLDLELQDLTTLMDEFADNLDQYADRKADLRKALKPLVEDTRNWLAVLRTLAGDQGFELSRKEALECADDLHDLSQRLLREQETYFEEHKDEAGQQRYEPK